MEIFQYKKIRKKEALEFLCDPNGNGQMRNDEARGCELTEESHMSMRL